MKNLISLRDKVELLMYFIPIRNFLPAIPNPELFIFIYIIPTDVGECIRFVYQNLNKYGFGFSKVETKLIISTVYEKIKVICYTCAVNINSYSSH